MLKFFFTFFPKIVFYRQTFLFLLLMNDVTCGGGSLVGDKTGDVDVEFGRMATDVDVKGGDTSRVGDDVVETAGTLKRLDQLLEMDSLLPRF